MEAMTEKRLLEINDIGFLCDGGVDGCPRERHGKACSSVMGPELLAEVRRLRTENDRESARWHNVNEGLRAEVEAYRMGAGYLSDRAEAAEERAKALESAAQGLLGARDGLAKARLDDVGPLGVHEALEVVMAAERSLRALLAGCIPCRKGEDHFEGVAYACGRGRG